MRSCIRRVCIQRALILALVAAAVVPAARAGDLGLTIGSTGAVFGSAANRDTPATGRTDVGLCGGVVALPAVEPAAGDHPVDACGHHDPSCIDSDRCADPAPGCCGIDDTGDAPRRFYITGIIGASFGVLQSGGTNTALGPLGDFQNTGWAGTDLLTAGAAAGTAFARPNGWLRLEVEGRGRDILAGQTDSFAPPTPIFFYQVRAADGWSVLANVWRDWSLTERLGFYGGGGIGGGGYRLTVDDGEVNGYGHTVAFAWQVGTGTTYRLTRRTTLDLGYRFFDTAPASVPLSTNSDGLPAGSYQSNFYASELLLSVRIYEPFRSRPVR